MQRNDHVKKLIEDTNYGGREMKNDYASFDLEYLHSVLSFKELVRFGY